MEEPNLPERQELDDLLHLDGVLIDSPLPESAITQWQDRFTSIADDLPHIAFADLPLQHRWLLKQHPISGRKAYFGSFRQVHSRFTEK